MGIEKSWARVATEQKPGPSGLPLEEYGAAVHRAYGVERVGPDGSEALIKVRVYPSLDRVQQWQVDASGSPDYTLPPIQAYPEAIGEYTVLVAGKPALQILGLDKDPFPAPQGTPTNERWSNLAAAARYLHTLPEFAEARAV